MDINCKKKFQALNANNNWQELKSIWNNLNNNASFDFDIYQEIDCDENVKEIFEKYTSSEKASKDNIYDYQLISYNLIKKLRKEQLIEFKEKLFLYYLFKNRIDHITRTYSPYVVSCYMTTFEDMESRDSLDNLEQRYKLLEKIFKSGKIKQSVYKKTMQEIKLNLYIVKLIEKSDPFDSNIGNILNDLKTLKIQPDFDDNLIELVVELNK